MTATLRDAQGKKIVRPIDVRTHPISGRRCRITFSRSLECEPGTEALPPPPPGAEKETDCPFCPANMEDSTPRMQSGLDSQGRLIHGTSILFPNLFPYGSYSAVSLFDNTHFVEIGKAPAGAYADCFLNCSRYLAKISAHDPEAVYMAITQNHLPSAGGSLVHPHLQINADRLPANHQRILLQRAKMPPQR